MYLLIILLYFSDGHHDTAIVNAHATYSSCVDAGDEAMKHSFKQYRVLAYKCEQAV